MGAYTLLRKKIPAPPDSDGELQKTADKYGVVINYRSNFVFTPQGGGYCWSPKLVCERAELQDGPAAAQAANV